MISKSKKKQIISKYKQVQIRTNDQIAIRENPHKSRIRMTQMLCFLFICSIFFISACGKKNYPLPQKTDELFSFQNVFAELMPDSSIQVNGEIIGAIENLQAIVLETQALDESCATCPFVPLESFPINPTDIWQAENTFSFVVQPKTKNIVPIYRWRIIGHNAISGLPTVISPVLLTQTDTTP